MKPKVLKYGQRGVDVALRSYTDPGNDTVFWSKQRYHDDGSPAGGFNSFVCVADEKGEWLTEDGQKVALLSINGIGEIRWRISTAAYDLRNAEGSIEHFNLKPVPR